MGVSGAAISEHLTGIHTTAVGYRLYRYEEGRARLSPVPGGVETKPTPDSVIPAESFRKLARCSPTPSTSTNKALEKPALPSGQGLFGKSVP